LNGFSGKSATIYATPELLSAVEEAVPYAKVYPDSNLDMLSSAHVRN